MKTEADAIDEFYRQMGYVIDSKFLQRLRDGEPFSYDAFYFGIACGMRLIMGTNSFDFDAVHKRAERAKERDEVKKQYYELMIYATRAIPIEIEFVV